MKAILKLYFLCLTLKSVCGLPDFEGIPSIDELLLSSIQEDQDVCSNVTSYACISRELINYISADYYKNKAESYIRKKAIEILNTYTSRPELLNFNTEGEIAKFLKKEVEWYSMCKANVSYENLDTLKRIVMNSGGLQYIADEIISWQYTVSSYALDLRFSPFFEVILNDDNTLLFRRPSNMVSFKRLSDDGLTLLIDKFYSVFSIDSVNGLQRFTEAKEEIKNSLNAAVTTFLNLLHNKDSKFIYMKVSKFINIMEEEITYDYDWMEQFRVLYRNVPDDGSFFFDINYFKKLTLFLNKLKGGEIINLIHFLYTMNSMILTTWNNDESLSAFRYTEEECFTNMPMKFGIIRKVINDHLPDKYSLLKNMFENIVTEYVLQINNSWLNDSAKTIFIDDLLMDLQLTTTDGSLDQKLMGAYQGEIQRTLLWTIRSANMHRNYLINRIIADGFLKNRKYTSSESINSNSQQLVPYVKYNHLTKSLEIKLTDLCLPYFDSHLPIAWIYAYYGVAIARKISEFLLTYLDSALKLANSFAERVACFKRMQKSVWDKVNLYELINNNVGLTMAYKAYKREQLLMKHPIQKINGLNYNTRPQQFFLAYSAIYCQETVPEKVDLCASNLGNFQRSFKCDIDSQMNREEKCKLWVRS